MTDDHNQAMADLRSSVRNAHRDQLVACVLELLDDIDVSTSAHLLATIMRHVVSRPKDPFVSVPERPARPADTFRELVDYSRLVEKLLRDAPELGLAHMVTDLNINAETWRAQINTHAYGRDYKITIERQ